MDKLNPSRAHRPEAIPFTPAETRHYVGYAGRRVPKTAYCEALHFSIAVCRPAWPEQSAAYRTPQQTRKSRAGVSRR